MYIDGNSTIMQIAVIGSGYVGTTLAAGLADSGHDVLAVDIDADVVAALNAGETPIHEPGLDSLIAEHAGDRLHATTDYSDITDTGLVFVAVQTPSRSDGSIDMTALAAATEKAASTLARDGNRDDGYLLVIKSTVTPPQISKLQETVEQIATDHDADLELATNPEFLREGTAVEDFQSPDKLVFGTTTNAAADRLASAYAPIAGAADPAIIVTDPQTASMIKYANNAFLASKISLINDIGNICKEFGIDAYEVADAIGTDQRIGAQFLRSGVGWGGSCFPKDVRAIIAAATETGYDPKLLQAAVDVNAVQPQRLLELLTDHVDPADARIAVLGLAFKPGTDDIRNSRAIPVIRALQERGADIVAYDPVATEPMRERFPDIAYASSAEAALDGADGAVVVTDWDEFAALDGAFDTMRNPVVVDGRRIIEPREGMTYEGLTW